MKNYTEEGAEPPTKCDVCHRIINDFEKVVEISERTIHKGTVAYYDHHVRLNLVCRECYDQGMRNPWKLWQKAKKKKELNH
jgi:hypothetical protein